MGNLNSKQKQPELDFWAPPTLEYSLVPRPPQREPHSQRVSRLALYECQSYPSSSESVPNLEPDLTSLSSYGPPSPSRSEGSRDLWLRPGPISQHAEKVSRVSTDGYFRAYLDNTDFEFLQPPSPKRCRSQVSTFSRASHTRTHSNTTVITVDDFDKQIPPKVPPHVFLLGKTVAKPRPAGQEGQRRRARSESIPTEMYTRRCSFHKTFVKEPLEQLESNKRHSCLGLDPTPQPDEEEPQRKLKVVNGEETLVTAPRKYFVPSKAVLGDDNYTQNYSASP